MFSTRIALRQSGDLGGKLARLDLSAMRPMNVAHRERGEFFRESRRRKQHRNGGALHHCLIQSDVNDLRIVIPVLLITPYSPRRPISCELNDSFGREKGSYAVQDVSRVNWIAEPFRVANKRIAFTRTYPLILLFRNYPS
jgi:hypothetical protein